VAKKGKHTTKKRCRPKFWGSRDIGEGGSLNRGTGREGVLLVEFTIQDKKRKDHDYEKMEKNS